jgi:hypothetical protein
MTFLVFLRCDRVCDPLLVMRFFVFNEKLTYEEVQSE